MSDSASPSLLSPGLLSPGQASPGPASPGYRPGAVPALDDLITLPLIVGAPGGPDPAEAARLRAAGLLRRVVLDAHVPADVPDSPGLRAVALAGLLPGRLVDAGAVVALDTAAWAFAGGVAPGCVDVVLPPERHLPGNRTVRVHQIRLAPSDVVVLGPLRLTSPVRTAADLARRTTCLVEELCWLGSATDCRPEEVLARLDLMSGHRGVAVARRRVAAWSAWSPAGGTDREGNG